MIRRLQTNAGSPALLTICCLSWKEERIKEMIQFSEMWRHLRCDNSGEWNFDVHRSKYQTVPFSTATLSKSCLAWSLDANELPSRYSFTFWKTSWKQFVPVSNSHSLFSLSTTYPYQATRDAPILVYLGQFKMPFKKRKKGNGSTKILIGDSLPRIVQFFSTCV